MLVSGTVKLSSCFAGIDSLSGLSSLEISQKLSRFIGGRSRPLGNVDIAFVTALYLFCNICSQGQVNCILPALHIRVVSQIPSNAGLGSSAAYSVCLSAAFLYCAGQVEWTASSVRVATSGDGVFQPAGRSFSDYRLINQWALIGEKIVHGSPSGLDNSVSVLGGAISFENGSICLLKKMPSLDILMTDTRVLRSTHAIVAGVRERHEEIENSGIYLDLTRIIKKNPHRIMHVLDQMGDLALHSVDIYTRIASNSRCEEDYSQLEDLIDGNQQLLNEIGVGHPSVDKVISKARCYGLHSKLTGAGGGGCVYTLLRPGTDSVLVDKLCQELKQMGFDCWRTSLGDSGILIHPEPHNDSNIDAQILSQFSTAL